MGEGRTRRRADSGRLELADTGGLRGVGGNPERLGCQPAPDPHLSVGRIVRRQKANVDRPSARPAPSAAMPRLQPLRLRGHQRQRLGMDPQPVGKGSIRAGVRVPIRSERPRREATDAATTASGASCAAVRGSAFADARAVPTATGSTRQPQRHSGVSGGVARCPCFVARRCGPSDLCHSDPPHSGGGAGETSPAARSADQEPAPRKPVTGPAGGWGATRTGAFAMPQDPRSGAAPRAQAPLGHAVREALLPDAPERLTRRDPLRSTRCHRRNFLHSTNASVPVRPHNRA